MAKLTPDDQAVHDKIYGLDLKRCVECTTKEQNWSSEEAAEAELWYRHFLWMCYVNGTRQVPVPSSGADKLWHNHILDTPTYRKDCDAMFGGYLDHERMDGKPAPAMVADAAAMSKGVITAPMPDSVTSCSGCVTGGG